MSTVKIVITYLSQLSHNQINLEDPTIKLFHVYKEHLIFAAFF